MIPLFVLGAEFRNFRVREFLIPHGSLSSNVENNAIDGRAVRVGHEFLGGCQ